MRVSLSRRSHGDGAENAVMNLLSLGEMLSWDGHGTLWKNRSQLLALGQGVLRPVHPFASVPGTDRSCLRCPANGGAKMGYAERKEAGDWGEEAGEDAKSGLRRNRKI